MQHRIEYLGVYQGKPWIMVDEWTENALWEEEMGYLNDYQTTFGIEFDTYNISDSHLTITDYQNRTWFFKYDPMRGEIDFEGLKK